MKQEQKDQYELSFTQIIKRINKFAKTNKSEVIREHGFVYRSDTKQLFHISDKDVPTLINEGYLKAHENIRTALITEFREKLDEGFNPVPREALAHQDDVNNLTNEYQRILTELLKHGCKLRKTKDNTFMIERLPEEETPSPAANNDIEGNQPDSHSVDSDDNGNGGDFNG